MDHWVLASRFVGQGPDGDADASDRLLINELIIECSIGVHAHEREAPQRVRISIELDVRRAAVDVADEHANVVCYEDLVAGIKRIAAAGHINLVETLAEQIAALCLEDPRAVRVRVRAEKLDAQPDAASVGVEIERRRAPERPVNVYQLHAHDRRGRS